MVYIGIDWAEAQHDVCLIDEAGARLGKARVPDGIEGLARIRLAAVGTTHVIALCSGSPSSLCFTMADATHISAEDFPAHVAGTVGTRCRRWGLDHHERCRSVQYEPISTVSRHRRYHGERHLAVRAQHPRSKRMRTLPFRGPFRVAESRVDQRRHVSHDQGMGVRIKRDRQVLQHHAGLGRRDSHHGNPVPGGRDHSLLQRQLLDPDLCRGLSGTRRGVRGHHSDHRRWHQGDVQR